MFLIDFYLWWYGQGWLKRISALKDGIRGWYEFFSFGTLFKTLFAPWRQTGLSSAQHGSLRAKWDSILDKTVSRMVGASVRTVLLLVGMVTFFLVLALGILAVLLWPLLPLLPVALIVFGASQ